MKKILNVAAMLLLVAGLNNVKAQTFGVQLGVNANTMQMENNLLDIIPIAGDVIEFGEEFGIEVPE